MSTISEHDTAVVSLRNTSVRIDPFRYPADVGALADALLVAERVIVSVETLQEVLGVAAWLGDAFESLLRDGTIRFFFPEGNLEPTIFENDLYILAHSREGLEFRIESPLEANTGGREIEAELEQLLATYPYIPQDLVFGINARRLVAQSAVLATPRFPQLVRQAVARFFSTSKDVARVSNEYFSSRGVSNPFPEGLAIDERGKVLTNGPVLDLDRPALHLLLQQLQRFFVSGLLGADTQLIETGDPKLLAAAIAAAGGPRDAVAFTQILDLEGIPSVRASVLMDEIPGSEIVKLRNSKDGQRFRAWLRQRSPESSPKDVLAAYHRTLGTVMHKDSLGFGGLRVLGAIAAGLINPVAGIVGSVADFVFGKTYYRENWHPRLFVRSLPAKGDPTFDPHVPVDPSRMLDMGARVEEARVGRSGASLKLVRREPNPYAPERDFVEIWDIGYAPDAHTLRIFNKRMNVLLSVADTPIIVECRTCGEENPFQPGTPIENAACRKCKTLVFPLTLP